jgi:hypothetical protein
MSQRFDVYDTIALIRPRPAKYIGACSLFRLYMFLEGCFHTARLYGIERSEQPDFSRFHDWVARRFGWQESTAGWYTIILKESGGDEDKALNHFFELIDVYRQRA